jgi:ketosteroid isomerase-like protein
MEPQAIYWSTINPGKCRKRSAHYMLGDSQVPPDDILVHRVTHHAVLKVLDSPDLHAGDAAIRKSVATLPDRLRDGAFQHIATVAKGTRDVLPAEMETRHVTWFDDVIGRPYAADVIVEDDGKVVTIYEILEEGDVSRTQKERMHFKGLVVGLALRAKGEKAKAVRMVVKRPAVKGDKPAPGAYLWHEYFDTSEAGLNAKLGRCRAYLQQLQEEITTQTVRATNGPQCNRCPFMVGCKDGQRFVFGNENAIPFTLDSVLNGKMAEVTA